MFKEYAIEHGKGKLPDLIMKNLDVQTLGQVKTAIDAGTLPRAMFADLHIAEEDSDDHPDQQGAATADVGIQILRSRDTEHYHAHGMYDHAGLDARRAAAWAKAAPAPVHAMVAATLTAEQFACAGSGDPEDAPEGAALGSTMMGAVPVKPPIDQIESTTHKSSRNGGKIDHIVIHYTGSRNVNGVIEHFKNGTPRVSAHYIVGQDGRLVQMVPDAEKAWHAGSASMNARSIGIEHAAEKHDTIAADQAAKSLALIKWLMSVHAIPASQIIPHCCVHQTDCCGDLFRDFGGGLGLSCDKQSAALRKWLAANGIAAHAVTAQADDRDGPPNVVGLLEARHTPPPVAPAVRPGQTVMAWEDDPDSGAPPRAVPVPNAAGSPLPFSLPNAPAPGNFPQRTREFRYWAAAEALTRGAEFWAPKLPQPPRWHTTVGAVMPVNLDAGNDLNAFYDRVSLQFFHGKGVGGDVFSGESPDVVCHELGHAVLDSLKPQLFDAASHEAAAFHESFGDMSAIMSALQIPSLRAAVLSETDTRLARNSRLSRLAEQLGSAIRLRRPDAVDADCLRNAANSLIYQNPLDLPFDAPATQLSSEAHSFSRVFTAAFLQALAGLADVRAAGARPGDADLQAVAVDLGNILVRGIRLAAVVPGFYAQVAAGMVEASRSVNPGYPGVLKEVFVRRGILPMNFAAVADDLQAAAGIAASHLSAAAMDQDLDPVAVDGRQFGLELDRLVLHAPTQPRRLSISAVTVDRRGAPAVSSDTAARAFASDLFQKGRVAMPAGTTRAGVASSGIPPERRHTHEIRVEGDIQVLRRRHFDCGFCEH